MSETMGTKDAAEKWGYTQAKIAEWCRKGLIENADHDGVGSPWHIPNRPIKTNKEKKK